MPERLTTLIIFSGVVIMGKLDDDFFDDVDFDELDTVQVKKYLNEKKRLLRERIELREIARTLEMSPEDWKEACPDWQ